MNENLLTDEQFLEIRKMEEYLRDPFRAPSALGKQIIVRTESYPTRLSCHHKVLPTFWQCHTCPPNDCSNRWDITAMHGSVRDCLTSCSHRNCTASVTSETVLVNTQKESIMTLGGENLMPSRVEPAFMWCCRCTSLQQVGRSQDTVCAHCVDFQESECPECLWCNEFFEPTVFANGDIVRWVRCTFTIGHWPRERAERFRHIGSLNGSPVLVTYLMRTR